jgi:hypothetical protein
VKKASGENLMVKLLMSWDIRPGRDEEYFEFAIRQFVPVLQKLGFNLTDAWFTMFGNAPQVLVGAVAEDLTTLRKALSSPEWKEVKAKLLAYVNNYTERAVPAGSRFQM